MKIKLHIAKQALVWAAFSCAASLCSYGSVKSVYGRHSAEVAYEFTPTSETSFTLGVVSTGKGEVTSGDYGYVFNNSGKGRTLVTAIREGTTVNGVPLDPNSPSFAACNYTNLGGVSHFFYDNVSVTWGPISTIELSRSGNSGSIYSDKLSVSAFSPRQHVYIVESSWVESHNHGLDSFNYFSGSPVEYRQTVVKYTFGDPPPPPPPRLGPPLVETNPPVYTDDASRTKIPKSNADEGSLISDPVNLVTGEFYINTVDLEIATGAQPLRVARNYSSRHVGSNEFGIGWLPAKSSYLVNSENFIVLQGADEKGNVVNFRKDVQLDIWRPTLLDNPEMGLAARSGTGPLFNSYVEKLPSGTYYWRMPSGAFRIYTLRSFPVTTIETTFSREKLYLTEESDALGNTTTYTYGEQTGANEYGRLTRVQSSSGARLDYLYNFGGLIQSITSDDGRALTYTYDGSRLASVTLADGKVISYTWSADMRGPYIVKVTKPDGRVLENTYDTFRRVIAQKATVGVAGALVTNATFDYTVPNQTTVKDAFNYTTIYTHANGHVTSILDPKGNHTTKTWYSDTNLALGTLARALASVTDARGLLTEYKYDAQGNVVETKITGDLDGDPATLETNLTTALYNSLDLPVSTTDASGLTTEFLYEDTDYPTLPTTLTTKKAGVTLRIDKLEYTEKSSGAITSRGLLRKITRAFGTAYEAVTLYDYDATGFRISETHPTGTADPDVVVTYAPTARREVLSSTDAEGRSTFYTYDGQSRPLIQTVKAEDGSTLAVSSTTYNANGEPSRVDGPRSAPEDWVEHDYDGAGRPKEDRLYRTQAKADGSGVSAPSAPDTYAKVTYQHDYFGNLTRTVDPRGNATAFIYDEIGQLLTRKAFAGTDTVNGTPLRTESFTYEPGGKVATYTNPLGGLTTTFYTAAGQPRRQENPDGSVQEWRYLPDGRLYREFLRDQSYWQTTYDDVNRIVTRTLKAPGGTTTLAVESSTRDPRGNVISTTNQAGDITETTCDDLDRPIVVTGPPAATGSPRQITRFSYSAGGKTRRTLNTLDEETILTSDALGRPVLRQVKSSAGTVIRQTAYAYSTDHQAVTVTEGTGTGALVTTAYTDPAGHPLLTRHADGTFAYRTYDLGGNLLTSTDELDRTTTYGYDALNQLSTQSLPDGNLTTFFYDAAGHPTVRQMAAGFSSETLYDNAGRPTSSRLFNGTVASRVYTHTYYPSTHATWAGLPATTTDPRGIVRTITYDARLRPDTLTLDGPTPETDGSLGFTYDSRGLVTAIAQSSPGAAAGPATQVGRAYDAYGQLRTESLIVGGQAFSSVAQTWDAAGRRATLHDSSATVAAPLFAFQHRADGALTQVNASTSTSTYNFAYSDNGLILSRINPFRSLAINTRDSLGRSLQQTTTVAGAAALVETLAWRADGTLLAYGANRFGSGAWDETRPYAYDDRGHLLSEGFAPAAAQTQTLRYEFDHATPGLGIRTSARLGAGAPLSWEASTQTITPLARVTEDNITAAGRYFQATGVALGADHVNISVDGIALGRATHPGWNAPVGDWSLGLNLTPGSHTLVAEAVHPSGQFTTSATSTFTVGGTTAGSGLVTSTYDEEGNVVSRTWSNGRVQTLVWDGWNRLIRVTERNPAQDGYDWSAVYDGLGRRLRTTHQPIVANAASGSPLEIRSTFDPQVEFLEIGVAVNGAKAWKVYGPDLNGTYGGLNGTGGLEATIMDATGTAKGVLNDHFGNGVASVSAGTVTWFTTRVGGYGPLPGTSAEALTDATRVAEATAWRSRRIDPTGFYNLGARYYEPTSGRFLSPDPLGHAASMSLYDFANGDPVNGFDPDGRNVVGEFAHEFNVISQAASVRLIDGLSASAVEMGSIGLDVINDTAAAAYGVDPAKDGWDPISKTIGGKKCGQSNARVLGALALNGAVEFIKTPYLVGKDFGSGNYNSAQDRLSGLLVALAGGELTQGLGKIGALDDFASVSIEAAETRAVTLAPSLAGSDAELAAAAARVAPKSGYFDVVIHGDANGFYVVRNGEWTPVSHRSLATFVEKSGWNGEPLRLISCNTGTTPFGPAQNLANKLGVEVIAPDSFAHLLPSGNVFVGPNSAYNTGNWVQFLPGKF
jgi:RHS repeat-associated protein